MSTSLQVKMGHYSDKGRKPLNQDCHASLVPDEPALGSKGIVVALADGISSSDVSQIASEMSVKGFLEDYYATGDSWSVKSSAQRVIQATNSWLYSQTRSGPYRYDMNRGYVCTFSTLVLKSNTAYIFHIGDSRVYRRAGRKLEQLTEDHRLWVSREKSYLSRAMGMRDCIEIDFQERSLEVGDTFILATDGVYEFADNAFITESLDKHSNDLDQAAKEIVTEALRRGSDDNLTIQIVHIEELPKHGAGELQQKASVLPFPPELRPRTNFDGYQILREIASSYRSHLYLVLDQETNQQLVLKTPSVDLRDDPAYLEHFLMEEWVASRIDNAHILKPSVRSRKRHYLYIVTEFIEGKTLTQWMADNPHPELEIVRDLLEQITRGLRAMHRQEMLHQDLRPNNIMIDANGTVKIIDFGSVRVAGIAETQSAQKQEHILGTAQYTAPEYFLGESGTTQSDLFSLGVIAYQMLSGRLPYGTNVAKATSRSAQHRLVYQTVLDNKCVIPAWIDETIRKAVHPNPAKRYAQLSEFIYDLRHPNPVFISSGRAPLLERNPVFFWKGVSLILFVFVILLLSTHLK